MPRSRSPPRPTGPPPAEVPYTRRTLEWFVVQRIWLAALQAIAEHEEVVLDNLVVEVVVER